ncbi:MAG TPA: carboxypeptidase regulatory-like domain-containing protein [Phnomibacter sp.]|nr:carboxypeptidase regulatory-like domain-containing protein [Phnomibacter sp.]
MFFLLSLLPCSVFSQETNSQLRGVVKSVSDEKFTGANIALVHEPTKNRYHTQTNADGYFYFFNLKPGGPYTVSVSYIGYDSLKRSDIYLSYSLHQQEEFLECILKENDHLLQQVQLVGKKSGDSKFGAETHITREKMDALPSISRNLQDYVRMVPQGKVNGEGMMSLAGQNNKYNAFFIDGSNNNDLLGIAMSGTSGGQTGAPPISMEAIEEINVYLSPYDVQYSNFTGGSINAITRSGTNQFKSSAWYFFRNEQMVGKSPTDQSKISELLNQTAGAWISGPMVNNKLFYFLLAERQEELQPQPFDFAQYEGNSTKEQVAAFADTLRKRYAYDAGSFLESKDQLKATRFVLKLDWNPSEKNKFTFSYRYNDAERIAPQSLNGSTLIRFSNNSSIIPSSIHSASLEWRTFLNHAMNSRLLLTFHDEVGDRSITGAPFPTIGIRDGTGRIIAGTNPVAQVNKFKARDISLIDMFKFSMGKQVFTTGFEMDFAKMNDIILISYFGNYQFQNFSDFYADAYPANFSRMFSLVDEPKNDNTDAAALYKTQRIGFFLNDEIQLNPRFRLNLGIRVDGNALPLPYQADDFFNTVGKSYIEKYYDLKGAQSGKSMQTSWQVSPRVGFVYQLPINRITFRGGAGLFTGHILNIWASEVYYENEAVLAPQQYGVRFNPDPYNQPDFQSLGINPEDAKGNIGLMANNFKYPSVFRTHIGMDKKFTHGWSFTTELMYNTNIQENFYTNVNLLPPTKKSAPPDERNVYSTSEMPEKIPMDGGNPYNNILLLSNNKGKRGFAYSLSAVVSKTFQQHFSLEAAYTYGRSFAVFEPTARAGGSTDQWEQSETVNGKNFTARTISDFDLKHRVYLNLTKKFTYAKNRMSTLLTVCYNGQSGSPYSYVYNGSMINDNGSGENFDLMYIPTATELTEMIFLPNPIDGATYTPQQQKEYLNEFIEKDKYLRKHRGQFAERNAATLPFTHIIDIRLQQDFIIKWNKGKLNCSIIYDVFNFTNMLNQHWGRQYTLLQDNFGLISFEGFANQNSLTPQYKFKPINGDPWSVQTSTAPGSSARWISQLGFKIKFN